MAKKTKKIDIVPEESSEQAELEDKKSEDSEELDKAKNEEAASDSNIKKPEVKKQRFFQNPKKRLLFIISTGLLLILLCGIGLYFLLYEKPGRPSISETQEKIESQPELFESALNGLLVEKAASERHPLAVVVENHPDARPQSGLSQADIVYEAIAEGGITRFLALFGTKEAEKVGPVRSARTFFVDWAHGYNAYLAHVGGNMDALDKIKAEKTPDLDQFANPRPYWREYSPGLATEHTMYANTIKLRTLAAEKNYSSANNFNLWKFKDDPEDKSTLPDSQKIIVNFSQSQYNVSFAYDKTTNSYNRVMAGKPHNDKITKGQIAPKNIIVMTVKRKPVITRINEPGYEMTTTGNGKATVFLDGRKIEGTWKKQSASDREIFYDENGEEITFGRGQFWICVVPPEVSAKTE